MPGEWNPPSDKAIDDAARELTEGRPRAALRTNVAARIAGHQSSPWGLGWVAASAVAAVVIGAVLMWPARVEDNDPVPAADVVQDRQDTSVGRAASGPPVEPDRVRPTRGPAAVVATQPVESLTIEAMEVSAVAIDELDVAMLTVEDITLEPLTVPVMQQ